MTHEKLKKCIGEYRELKKDLWWVNRWGVQKIDGYDFGIHYNDFAEHWQFSWCNAENEFKVADIEDIFETKEDAEWHKEFGCIERTEQLVLPTWEEFSKCDKIVKFFTREIFYSMYVFEKNKSTNDCWIIIRADNGERDWWVFEEKLTKVNYTIACRKCRGLFFR